MKRRKRQLRRAVSLSAEVAPSAVSPQVLPSPEVNPDDVSIIGISLASKQDDTPTHWNIFGLLVRVTDSDERTANLERLIWSLTGLMALGVDALSLLAIFALHYRLAGSIGLAIATIAGIMSRVAKKARRK